MITQDPSYKSLELLNLHLSRYFEGPVHFVDLPESKNHSNNSERVVATGLYYQRIFELDYWPKNRFYLYCLCHSVKKVLVEIFNFDEECIKVIPRYELIPQNKTPIGFDLNKNLNLVYAGRFSPHKNIEFLIFISFYLQLFKSQDVQLLLMGHFDNEHHRDKLNINHVDYETKILKIIESLPWSGKKPEIISHLSSDEWIKLIPDNCAFITASNVLSEDFSMSVAQLQSEKPIPLILPTWGAFKDIIGSNVNFYDSNLIASTYDSLNIISQKAKKMANIISHENYIKINQPEIKDTENHIPIDRIYLEKKINENLKRWGDEEIRHITKGEFFKFANSHNGQVVLTHCKNIFSHYSQF